jgi:hypothetical protein
VPVILSVNGTVLPVVLSLASAGSYLIFIVSEFFWHRVLEGNRLHVFVQSWTFSIPNGGNPRTLQKFLQDSEQDIVSWE